MSSFVEATSGFKLDLWQHHLCERLARLEHERDQRIVIHAPPQFGKTVILSQRFPAWLLTRRPLITMKLACYNVTRATKHTRVARDLMQSKEFIEMFPDPNLRLPATVSAEEWSTSARLQLRDGQASYKALGLVTGFVGEGADLLLIDDPYASPEDARSAIVNEKICSFWPDTARPRMKPGANVVMMFHRYVEDDKAGRVLAEGGWEYLRYAAIADGDYELPETPYKWADPMDRQKGEYLSQRFPEDWYAERQLKQYVWLSQFQGRPTAKGGIFFKEEWFGESLPAAPAGCQRIRYWDKAGADEGKGDWTVGVLMAKDVNGMFYVEDVSRFQLTAFPRNQKIVSTAEADREKYGRVQTWVEQPPGLAKESTDTIIRQLAGFPVAADPVHRDKIERAEPFKDQCEAGNVKLIRGDWVRKYKDELCAFPNGKHDDQVDASSGAFNKLVTKRKWETA